MERRHLIERIEELQREIAQISAANHAYFACRKVDSSKKLLRERRHERLQEIKEELASLRRPFRGAAFRLLVSVQLTGTWQKTVQRPLPSTSLR